MWLLRNSNEIAGGSRSGQRYTLRGSKTWEGGMPSDPLRWA